MQTAVAEGLVPEEAAHPVGRIRQLAHAPDDGALEPRLAPRRLLAGDRLLQVSVDALVRVRLWAVSGVGRTPRSRPRARPARHGPCGAVDGQAVEDEEDL